MADEKIYVGKGVEKFNGDQVACSICLSDIPEEHRFEYQGKIYVKVIVQRRQNPDQYGKTHFVIIDTWKPDGDKQKGTAPAPASIPAPVPVAKPDVLPF